MATISALVYKQQQKNDGTYNVKIRLHHKNERRLIKTQYYVSQRHLNDKLQITDPIINNLTNDTIYDYRRIISKLGKALKSMSCDDLKNYLEGGDSIDFIKFCDEHIAMLKEADRIGTANNHRTIRNSLVDYFKKECVTIIEINSNMLFAYDSYLRTGRIMKRKNHSGLEVIIKKTGLSDNGLHSHMKDLRTLFNAARARYNNEDLGIYQIEHNPFKKYKVGPSPLTKKRNISIEELKIVRDCNTEPGSRAELAKDLFMLSFYLCGMNAVDIYKLKKENIQDGRISYNRSKTVRQRKDNAFISIKIIEKALPLLNQYIEQLSLKYKNNLGLDTALSKGMKELREITGIPNITFYYARHTFANTARNACRVSKDDLDLALNHVDQRHRILDIYLDKDWGIIDEVQEKVVQLLTK
ncbi:phage integrase SAM-like domain-containing protein [Mucilaginibacter sp. X5P1]|uniref:site-specific integrase n=1 Tax=Mucilaginibacter sp. X5P1 TaxID=2723088 RepID=UPI00160D484C|nr:site-specific integrase [Mucilaginibacter sp. X5P1]MBB6141855.1 integrase [Mucilaginibacter sp. X5P1]